MDDVLNPVAGVPLVGDLLVLLDGFATQLGMPFWMRAFVEFVLVAYLGFALLRLLATRGLPLLGAALVTPVVLLAEAVRVCLLVPDLAVSRVFRRFDRVPPEVVYGYGAAVVAVVDAVQGFARQGLPKLAITRAAPRWVLVVALTAGFLVWNDRECLPVENAVCTSPVNHWTTSLTTWMDQQ
ncbi:hypothetical protein [Umezawaea sp.]|uniref:hypothetical protein n=1 Tax=Umezawaea sp. TaxID=1955258 RepID=UPI002ED34C35